MMDKIDFDRISTLLGIVEKQVTVAPRLTSIAGAAMDELNDINEEIRAGREERTLAEKRKEDERIGQQQAEAAKRQEAEAEEMAKQQAEAQPPVEKIDTTPGMPSAQPVPNPSNDDERIERRA